jgi:hypothetical protein
MRESQIAEFGLEFELESSWNRVGNRVGKTELKI